MHVRDHADRRPALQAAVAIYTGDLLEDHFDEWLAAERERLQARHLTAVE
jgi:DNA-binding SARP family transcriptional activator